MVRACTESLLKQVVDTDRVQADADGDYPVRYESALYYVRIEVGRKDDPVVQVFAIAVNGVDPTPDLYEELNNINSRLRFARVFWVRDQVLIESELTGDSMSILGLRQCLPGRCECSRLLRAKAG
jgi:hypothetical protein